MSSADMDSRLHFARLQRIEADLETLMKTKQLKEMRVWVRNVSILCGTILFLYFVGRPVFWNFNTLYGTQKYHSQPAIIEPAPDSAPLYEGDTSLQEIGADLGIPLEDPGDDVKSAQADEDRPAADDPPQDEEEPVSPSEEEPEENSPVDDVQAGLEDPLPTGDAQMEAAPVEEEEGGAAPVDEEEGTLDRDPEPLLPDSTRKLLWRSYV